MYVPTPTLSRVIAQEMFTIANEELSVSKRVLALANISKYGNKIPPEFLKFVCTYCNENLLASVSLDTHKAVKLAIDRNFPDEVVKLAEEFFNPKEREVKVIPSKLELLTYEHELFRCVDGWFNFNETTHASSIKAILVQPASQIPFNETIRNSPQSRIARQFLNSYRAPACIPKSEYGSEQESGSSSDKLGDNHCRLFEDGHLSESEEESAMPLKTDKTTSSQAFDLMFKFDSDSE